MTMTTTRGRFDKRTRKTPTWQGHDSYNRPYSTPTMSYRPHIPQCTHCYKNGHTRQTCHKLIGYPSHYQFGRTDREHWERTGFQKRHWDTEHRLDRLPQKPATESEDQTPQRTSTTHHQDNTDEQTTTERGHTTIKEMLSLMIDRLANPQQHKTLVPIYIITLAGIGSLLRQTITSLASGSSQIIRALGAGIRDTFHGVGDLDE